jgi:hypothetical protein
MMENKIKFNRDKKFDLQLGDALIAEKRLAEIFCAGTIKKIELKTESWLWERTGNICIEYRQNGNPSGIDVTEADYWVHELVRDGETLCYLMFPVERLKQLIDQVGRRVQAGGDGGRFDNILIPLREILK